MLLVAAPVLEMERAEAKGVYTVPEGNRFKTQPKIPRSSFLRTRSSKSSFEKKYEKVRELLATDRKLLAKIKKVAKKYDIDPIHMVGALVGEHTYNIDVYDHLQTYYAKAAMYTGSRFRFEYEGESIEEFLERPQFEDCKDIKESYDLWGCRQAVWKKEFMGKTVDEKAFPKDRFSKVFFQPFYSGQTFGLGQINPLTALKLSDLVHKKSGYRKLDENDAAEVYKAIMEPDISLAFMAALIRKSIDEYRDVAGMDISKNPGITATLYNVGSPQERAHALRRKIKQSGKRIWPRENYYGWLVNDKVEDLRALISGKSAKKKD
ncbi:DUF1402 family protein [Cohaesibacter sp. ES.047]|uniref:DUF1402 family protein n=1 Tax=Cohaesibacter sp. ES.047 TaxID=1798205 RepID=UPI000BB778A4